MQRFTDINAIVNRMKEYWKMPAGTIREFGLQDCRRDLLALGVNKRTLATMIVGTSAFRPGCELRNYNYSEELRFFPKTQRLPFRFVYRSDYVFETKDEDVYRGIVCRLPAKKGQEFFLAGYESDYGICLDISQNMETKDEACRTANELAQSAMRREQDREDAYTLGAIFGDAYERISPETSDEDYDHLTDCALDALGRLPVPDTLKIWDDITNYCCVYLSPWAPKDSEHGHMANERRHHMVLIRSFCEGADICYEG